MFHLEGEVAMPGRLLLPLLVIALSLAVAPAAQAAQYVVPTPAGTKVVHTRLAPVLVHRILPPFYGRHVYQGRVR